MPEPQPETIAEVSWYLYTKRAEAKRLHSTL